MLARADWSYRGAAGAVMMMATAWTPPAHEWLATDYGGSWSQHMIGIGDLSTDGVDCIEQLF